MADEIPPDGPERKKKRARRKKLPDIPPIFAEDCAFCECWWPTTVKFYDVIVRKTHQKHRVCQYCVEVWNSDPAPDHPYFKVMMGKKIQEAFDKFTIQELREMMNIEKSEEDKSEDTCSTTGTDTPGTT